MDKTKIYAEVIDFLNNMYPDNLLDKEVIANIFDNYVKNKVVQIIPDNHKFDSVDSIENMNKLRVGEFGYISLKQLKDNIMDNSLNFIIKNLVVKEPECKDILLVILPAVFCCWHIVDKQFERCIFIEAIEFYKRDSLQFHSIEDFVPKLLATNECDNLTLSCCYRKNEKCFITLKNVASVLDSLVNKHILERNNKNEYRYYRW